MFVCLFVRLFVYVSVYVCMLEGEEKGYMCGCGCGRVDWCVTEIVFLISQVEECCKRLI